MVIGLSSTDRLQQTTRDRLCALHQITVHKKKLIACIVSYICFVMLLLLAVYIYMSGGDIQANNEVRLISPRFPRRNDGESKCFSFNFNIFGEYYGRLSVLDQDGDVKWTARGYDNMADQWFHVETTLSTAQTIFVLEASSRGMPEGDIAVDNLLLELLSCSSKLY